MDRLSSIRSRTAKSCHVDWTKQQGLFAATQVRSSASQLTFTVFLARPAGLATGFGPEVGAAAAGLAPVAGAAGAGLVSTLFTFCRVDDQISVGGWASAWCKRSCKRGRTTHARALAIAIHQPRVETRICSHQARLALQAQLWLLDSCASRARAVRRCWRTEGRLRCSRRLTGGCCHLGRLRLRLGTRLVLHLLLLQGGPQSMQASCLA